MDHLHVIKEIVDKDGQLFMLFFQVRYNLHKSKSNGKFNSTDLRTFVV
jgi:hypothetical protein